MRYFTGYNADNDVVRVTGYLVKKSEIEKLDNQDNQFSFENRAKPQEVEIYVYREVEQAFCNFHVL